MKNVFTYLTTSKYCDVGTDNLLTNIGFLKIFQEAGALHSDSIGWGPNNTLETDSAWIILNWKLQVYSRPQWNTSLKIITWTNIKDSFFCYRDFEIYDNTNTLLARASSKWVLLKYTTKHIRKIPEEVIEKFNCEKPIYFLDTLNKKYIEPSSFLNSTTYTVLKRDLDTNNHVNNLNYLHFALETLPENINSNFNNIEIYYKSESTLKDTLTLNYSIENSKHIVCVKNNSKLNAIIKMWVD